MEDNKHGHFDQHDMALELDCHAKVRASGQCTLHGVNCPSDPRHARLSNGSVNDNDLPINDKSVGDNAVFQSANVVGARHASAPQRFGGEAAGTCASFPRAGTIIDGQNLRFSAQRIIGNGSFGVVFQASIVETGEIVAIKKVLQDKRFKNRELHIMRQLAKDPHPNVIALKHCFYSSEKEGKSTQARHGRDGKDGREAYEATSSTSVYLNLVLEYMPETVYSVARRWQKSKTLMPISHVRVYFYQLCRALGQIHAIGICHRDVKPQNLLLNPECQLVKLIDFGSAKVLVPGEPNVSYICSRYYRAPELIFGSTEYTTAIDTWSSGCVLAELLLGSPLFPGDSGVDQLVEIIKVLGTPSKEEIRAMNASYTEFKFPQIRGHEWSQVFRTRTPPQAVECVSRFLVYSPQRRMLPLYAVAQGFFDELRLPGAMLDNGRPLPPLFDFTNVELASFPGLAELRPIATKTSESQFGVETHECRTGTRNADHSRCEMDI